MQNLYHFNGTDLTTDFSGNSRTLTKTGTVNNVAGKFGNCASATWNLTNNLRLASGGFNPGTGAFSMGCWFKKASPPTNDYSPTIIAIGLNTSRAWLGAVKTTGYAIFGTYDGTSSDVTTTINICDDKWHFVVITRAGTTHKILVDGVATTSTLTARNINATSFDIGQHQDGVNYDIIGDASMDEIFVFNKALSDAEVRKWYAWSKGKYL